jgi:hypothetical protein
MVGKMMNKRGELARWRALFVAFYFILVGSSLSLSFLVLPERILDAIPPVVKPVALGWLPDETAVRVAGEMVSISSGYHNPWRQRTVLSLTCTPLEMERLYGLVDRLLKYRRYDGVFDAIHVAVPRESFRFNETYPTSTELQQRLAIDNNPRVIVHRLLDMGPITRFIAPILYERHPDTRIVVVDIDSQGMDWQQRGMRFHSARFTEPTSRNGPDTRDLLHLVHNSQKVDPDAVWCLQGEDFSVNEASNTVEASWDTFPLHTSDKRGSIRWNQVHFCRATGGVLVKPRHFQGFQYNQTSYHPSCFWDDDRWIGFQMERLGTPLKVLQPERNREDSVKDSLLWQRRRLGALSGLTELNTRLQSQQTRRRLGALSGLTELNTRLQSQQTCTLAWMAQHPESFPTARLHTTPS